MFKDRQNLALLCAGYPTYVKTQKDLESTYGALYDAPEDAQGFAAGHYGPDMTSMNPQIDLKGVAAACATIAAIDTDPDLRIFERYLRAANAMPVPLAIWLRREAMNWENDTPTVEYVEDSYHKLIAAYPELERHVAKSEDGRPVVVMTASLTGPAENSQALSIFNPHTAADFPSVFAADPTADSNYLGLAQAMWGGLDPVVGKGVWWYANNYETGQTVIPSQKWGTVVTDFWAWQWAKYNGLPAPWPGVRTYIIENVDTGGRDMVVLADKVLITHSGAPNEEGKIYRYAGRRAG